MKLAYIIPTMLFIVYQAINSSNAANDCPNCLRTSYETQKGSIEQLMKLGINTKSVFAEMFETILTKSSLSAGDRTTANEWLESVEDGIIRNNSVDCPTQKVLKVAMRMDQMFIGNPSIGNTGCSKKNGRRLIISKWDIDKA